MFKDFAYSFFCRPFSYKHAINIFPLGFHFLKAQMSFWDVIYRISSWQFTLLEASMKETGLWKPRIAKDSGAAVF